MVKGIEILHIYRNTYRQPRVHTYTSTYMHAHIHAYMHTQIQWKKEIKKGENLHHGNTESRSGSVFPEPKLTAIFFAVGEFYIHLWDKQTNKHLWSTIKAKHYKKRYVNQQVEISVSNNSEVVVDTGSQLQAISMVSESPCPYSKHIPHTILHTGQCVCVCVWLYFSVCVCVQFNTGAMRKWKRNEKEVSKMKATEITPDLDGW